MHENREISCTSCSKEQDRTAKAINRTADMHVQEKSDCAVVPVNQSNKEAQASAEAGEGRAQTKENIVKVSGFPCPRCLRFRTANRPNSIRRVLSGCNSRPNLTSRSRNSDRNRSASARC